MATEPGLVLPEGVLPTAGGHTFPPFPGVYEPGVPVALTALGLTLQEARDGIKEYDLPLKEARADEPAPDLSSEPEALKPTVPTVPAEEVEE